MTLIVSGVATLSYLEDYAEIHWSALPNAIATDMVGTTVTPIKAAGVTTGSAQSANMNTATNNRIQYTGALTKKFVVNASLSVAKAGGGSVECYASIAVNGTPEAESSIQRTVTSTGTGSVSLTSVVTLAQNQYVEIFLSADVDDDITIQYGTLAAHELFGA